MEWGFSVVPSSLVTSARPHQEKCKAQAGDSSIERFNAVFVQIMKPLTVNFLRPDIYSHNPDCKSDPLVTPTDDPEPYDRWGHD